MKLYNKIFESENIEFRKRPNARQDVSNLSMGEWENQEEINREFRDLVHKELADPKNRKIINGEPIVDLNHLSQEAFRSTDLSMLFYEFYAWADHLSTTIDISEWNVSRCRDFSRMFTHLERFNCDLSKWDVSQGRSFHGMFGACHNFNSDLSKWDVSQGENFIGMFGGCHNFNSDLSNWDVSRGQDFHRMFWDCRNFNSDLSKWDVSNGVHFSRMFSGCLNFNSDLSNWAVSDKAPTSGMFYACPIEENFKPKKL